MSATISVLYDSACTVTETNTGAFVSSVDNTVTFNGLNETGTLTASTTVPVTKHAEYELTMSGGTGTIDLTALPGQTVDETVVGTGLKVQVLKFKNKSTNANSITVAKGASSGYGINAAGTTWSIPISPGQSVTILGNDASPDIAGGAKTIDVTGTLSQVLQVQIVMG